MEATVTRRQRIAVVDDERPYAWASAFILGDAYDVVPLEDAAALLRDIESGAEFDLILADINMPGMTGLQMFERLRTIAPKQADRVYFLTAEPDSTSIPREIRNRVAGKPSMDVELMRFVEETLSRKSRRSRYSMF